MSLVGVISWVKPDPWWRRAILIDVHDGDTFHLKVDLGFRIFTDMPLRLQGVNAPELHQPDGTDNPAGIAAREWAKAWYASHQHGVAPAPWYFWVHTDHEAVTYNRYVARVFCVQGHDLAAELLASGNAVAHP